MKADAVFEPSALKRASRCFYLHFCQSCPLSVQLPPSQSSFTHIFMRVGQNHSAERSANTPIKRYEIRTQLLRLLINSFLLAMKHPDIVTSAIINAMGEGRGQGKERVRCGLIAVVSWIE